MRVGGPGALAWRQVGSTRFLVAPCIERIAGVGHGFFGRTGIAAEGRAPRGGAEPAGGNRERRGGEPIQPWRGFLPGEREAWDLAAAAIGFDPAHLVTVGQEHTDRIFVLERGPARPERGPRGHDALVSDRPGQAIGVLTADCAPVLVAGASGRVVAAIHAGWRGTAAGIVGKVVERLDRMGVPPSSLVAAIGPCVLPCCYPVGEEVVEAIGRAVGGARLDEVCPRRGDGRRAADLSRANRIALETAGVARERIEEARLCTSCHPEHFFSYRRDGAGTGRQASLVAGGMDPIRGCG